MKQILILVEGETELEFVKRVLNPFMSKAHDLYVTGTIIKTSQGHAGGYTTNFKTNKEIQRLVNSSVGIVTTMFDYYKIAKDFPGFEESKKIKSPIDKVQHIEDLWRKKINHIRFIPHLQLHEFEAILLCNIAPWEKWFDEEKEGLKKLRKVIEGSDNPEEINDRPNTSPSKRIEKCIKTYNKPLFGFEIASETGIETILIKCPHFRQWIELLVESCKKI